MTSDMVADTSLKHLHGSGAQFVETAGLSKPQIRKGDAECPARRNSGGAMNSTNVKNCVGRRSQSYSDENYGECVAAMHVLPINDGNRVVYRGGDAMLMAKGGTAPLMSDGDDWYSSNEFIRVDVWTPCRMSTRVRNLTRDES